LREAARRLYGNITPGWDVVLVARSPLFMVKEPQVEIDLRQSLLGAKLWREAEGLEE